MRRTIAPDSFSLRGVGLRRGQVPFATALLVSLFLSEKMRTITRRQGHQIPPADNARLVLVAARPRPVRLQPDPTVVPIRRQRTDLVFPIDAAFAQRPAHGTVALHAAVLRVLVRWGKAASIG